MSAEKYAEQIVATISQPLLVLTDDLSIERVNRAFCETFEVLSSEAEGRQLYDLGNGQWDIPELRRLLESIASEESVVTNYRVEHEFERIGRRVMCLNARRMRREGATDRILLAIDDITDVERQQRELEGRKEFAEKLIDSVRECLIILRWDLSVHSANQPFYEKFRVSREETEGRKIYELGNGQWNIPELRELLETILPRQWSFDDYEVEHEFEEIGRRIMLLNGRMLDHLDLIILAIRDVTDRREHERRQQAFVGEVQHRVRNILNNVGALASQLRRRSTDLDEFFDGFMARLAALARAQDLLVRSSKENADLADIVRVELEAVGAERGETYTVAGPSIRLSSRNAQAIAMAIHELATNAGKYGALKAAGGRVTVEWRTEKAGEEELRFWWRERGVRIEEPLIKRGYGSEVIEKSVPHMLGGTSELILHADGAECRIAFPLPTTKKQG